MAKEDLEEEARSWIIDQMKITVTRDQLLKAVLGIAGINLGKAEVYISEVKTDSNDDFTFDIRGME